MFYYASLKQYDTVRRGSGNHVAAVYQAVPNVLMSNDALAVMTTTR